VVTGIRQSLQKSIQTKKQTDAIVDVITAAFAEVFGLTEVHQVQVFGDESER